MSLILIIGCLPGTEKMDGVSICERANSQFQAFVFIDKFIFSERVVGIANHLRGRR